MNVGKRCETTPPCIVQRYALIAGGRRSLAIVFVSASSGTSRSPRAYVTLFVCRREQGAERRSFAPPLTLLYLAFVLFIVIARPAPQLLKKALLISVSFRLRVLPTTSTHRFCIRCCFQPSVRNWPHQL